MGEAVLEELESLPFKKLDHEWVPIIIDALIQEVGDSTDDRYGAAWIHRVINPILCCVREKYRAQIRFKKIRSSGLEIAMKRAPNVGDSFELTSVGSKSTQGKVRYGISQSDKFLYKRGYGHRPAIVKRVKE